MILGKTSNQKLKYAKAKAKQVEFSVNPALRPRYRAESDDLHYSAVLALADYAVARIDGSTGNELREDLEKVASFYDAAASEAEGTFSDDGYWQLAMATYFLIGNYGSAKVAASRIDDERHYGINSGRLTSLVRYLLDSAPRPTDLPDLCGFLEGDEVDEDAASEEALGLLSWESPEELFFGELLVVAIEDTLIASSRKLLPAYSNLDLETWRAYLKNANSSKILWQAQARIGEAGVLSGRNSFIQLPTGSGKTKSIELLIRSRIYAHACNLAIVVAPLRALCTEIAADLRRGINDIAEIRNTSEVLEVDPWLRYLSAKPKVIVFTPEKLSFIMHHEPNLLASIDLFVFDEAHLIDSPTRGPAYEMNLSEIKTRRPKAQIVLMSAVISNAKEVAGWAFGDSSLVVTGDGIQTTEKSIGSLARRGPSLDFGTKVVFGTKDSPFDQEYFANVDLVQQKLIKSPREKDRLFPDFSLGRSEVAREVATYYANRLVSNGASAIYIPKKTSIWAYFRRLGELNDRGCDLFGLKGVVDRSEVERFKTLVELHYGRGCSLAKGLAAGVLPHYGDLQGSIRQAAEFAVRNSHVRCIACTSTLAEGVNLPIRYLLITGFKTGKDNPRTRDFQNLIGRAARSGKYSEGTVLITDPGTSHSTTRGEYSRLYNESQTEACQSAILSLLKDEKNPKPNQRIQGLSGSSIVNAIIEHMGDADLEEKLADKFINSFSCDKREGKLLAEKRIRPLEAIESYIANAMSSDGEKLDVTQICAETFAYACSDNTERERLIKLFKSINEAFESEESRPLCGRTQLGMRKARGLASWVSRQTSRDFFASDMSDLTVLMEGFFEIARPQDLRLTAVQLKHVVDMWVGGSNIAEICESLSRSFGSTLSVKPNPQTVERVLSKIVKYTLSHFASCVIDALEMSMPPADRTWIEKMSDLQRRIKYGTEDPRIMTICEELFDDRIVASIIVNAVDHEWSPDAKTTRKIIKKYRRAVETELSKVPSYYLAELDKWLKE